MTDAGSWRLRARHWEIGEDRVEEFRHLGLPRRNYFPHQLRYIPVQGVDGYRIAKRMYGLDDPGAHVAVVLRAAGPALRRIPAELFVCRDVTWHQRHYGLPGHTAVAGLVLHGERLYTTVRISDIVQRISRRREHKTAVEHLLHGWDDMLLNGMVHFAGERGCREIVLPSAELALVHTARLVRCRRLDYRLRGYRAPRSRITDEQTDPLLAWHNFEWFSGSVRSLGLKPGPPKRYRRAPHRHRRIPPLSPLDALCGVARRPLHPHGPSAMVRVRPARLLRGVLARGIRRPAAALRRPGYAPHLRRGRRRHGAGSGRLSRDFGEPVRREARRGSGWRRR